MSGYGADGDDLALGAARSLEAALSRLPGAAGALSLAQRSGLWTVAAHRSPGPRQPFPATLADLDPAGLSDLYARWTAEYGRIAELAGALKGQRVVVAARTRSVRASARAAVRSRQDDGKRLSAAAVSDAAEDRPEVVAADAQAALVELLAAQVDAAREATSQYLATISREIAFREAQYRARILA